MFNLIKRILRLFITFEEPIIKEVPSFNDQRPEKKRRDEPYATFNDPH